MSLDNIKSQIPSSIANLIELQRKDLYIPKEIR